MSFLAASSSSLNDVEPGVLGFLVVAGIGAVLVFLLRSMNKQFRKLGPPPPEDPPEDAPGEQPADYDVGAGHGPRPGGRP